MGTQDRGLTGNALGRPDVQVVAVCDVKADQLKLAVDAVNKHYQNQDCRTYHDFRELVAVDPLRAGELVEFPLAERILDLPAIDRLVGAGADPRVHLLAHPLLLELPDDVGQLLGAAAAEDLREDVAEVGRGGHALGGPLLGLRLRGPLLRLLRLGLRRAFEHLLQDFTENVHCLAFRDGEESTATNS